MDLKPREPAGSPVCLIKNEKNTAMRQIYYTLRYLLHSRGNNGIKIISLALGLPMSLVLFAQVAFEMSYDNFYPDTDRLYRIRRVLNMTQEEKEKDMPIINAPVAPAMLKEFPEIESATVITSWSSDSKLTDEENRDFVVKTMIADSLFFDVFSLPLLEGNVLGFREPMSVYLSQSVAERIFGKTSAVGRILRDGEESYTVKGVYRDIPKNCHLTPEGIVSFKILGDWPGWHNNDAYCGYVRFRPGTDVKAVEAKIPDMLRKYYDYDAQISKGRNVRYFFEPVRQIHMSEPDVRKTVVILGLMAFSILLISVMNYVLISISSLANRAKAIGVYKCNGASAGNIFSMFVYETVALTLISLILAALLLFAFQHRIEELVRTSFSSIFAWSNSWVILAVIAAVIVVAGVIPGIVFSSVPVTQVFRNYGTNKRRWKQALLFIQLSGIAFMLTWLLILMRQYRQVLQEDLGYNTKDIVFASGLGDDITPERLLTIKNEIDRFPIVKKSSLSAFLPVYFVSGTFVTEIDTRQRLFSSRFAMIDKDFLEVMDIPLEAGENFRANTDSKEQMLVNRKFVELAGIEGDPVGKEYDVSFGPKTVISGVVRDFHLQYLNTRQLPLILFPSDPVKGYVFGTRYLIVRLASHDREALGMLNEKLRNLTHNRASYFKPYTDLISAGYHDAYLLRNSIFLASLLMFFITVIGILGYVADEMALRTKEIAIRRVNGASGSDILKIISRDIALIMIPALVAGMAAAWYVGSRWQEQFVVKAPWSAGLFLLAALLVVSAVFATVGYRCWRAVSDNPVNALKSE